MGDEVKESKNSNDLCSSDLSSSSSSGDRSSLGLDLNDNETRENVKYSIDIDALMDSVFGTDLVLEKVLIYALHTDSGELSAPFVQNVRRVRSSWCREATKIFNKIGQPGAKLTLTAENSLNTNDVVKENGKLLNRFVQTFTTSHSRVESCIPFKLELTAGFFWEENYDSLVDCLTRLGSYLVELQITYPRNGGSLPVNFPTLHLPSLRKLSFQFSNEEIDDDDMNSFGDNSRGIFLLQSIFNGAKNLEHFAHPFSYIKMVPRDFAFLQLPKTILTLDLHVRLESKGLRILLRNNFPKLQWLRLQLHDNPLEDDLLHKILQRVQNTLTTLHIEGFMCNGNPFPHTHLRFPIMKHLENLSINCEQCELGPGEMSCLEDRLPKLDYLLLTSQTESTFKKWIDRSTFANVESLNVSLIDERVEVTSSNYYVSLDMELIKGMQRAFPNLRKLGLIFNVSNTIDLRCVFEKMAQLEALQIGFHGSLKEYSSDLFDSTVLGCLPVALVPSLREHGKLIENIEVKGCKSTCISNLSELTSLILWTAPIPDEELGSLLSEKFVKYVLLEMPKLHCLHLAAKFKPSSDISKLWKDEGRFMKYYVKLP